jgi:integrase/recombinase XerD
MAAIAAGIPLNVLQQILGHTKMETMAIYANALGDEKKKIVARMWT